MYVIEIRTVEGIRYYRDKYEMCRLIEGPHFFYKESAAIAAAKWQRKYHNVVLVREVDQVAVTLK